MHKVNQLYVLWESYGGDKKLIPIDEYPKFIKDLRQAELAFENEVVYTPLEDQDEYRIYELQQGVYDLIDSYDTLEGEEVYVVLPSDLIKEVENEFKRVQL